MKDFYFLLHAYKLKNQQLHYIVTTDKAIIIYFLYCNFLL